jgi:hypothetical protein
MEHPNPFLDAIEAVLAWDLPDGALADALSAQLGLAAGVPPEEPYRPD